MPNVSFILPAFKRKFLAESIRSILAQTFRDFELVVVDDCSPEDLQSVVGSFADDRVRYVRNGQNLGGVNLVAAWNHAMSFARGEWCVLASDDDLYEPGFLEEMMRLAGKYPQCDLFHSRAAKIDASGRWLKVGDARVEFESQVQMAHSRGVLGLLQTAPDFMFRRSALERLGGFVDFPIAWYSDDATWISLARNGVACSPEVLFLSRVSGCNISGSVRNFSQKRQASLAYKAWLEGQVSGFVGSGKTDETLRDGLLNKMKWRIDENLREEIGRLPVWGRVRETLRFRLFKDA